MKNCHICGDMRPDNLISVHSKEDYPNDIPVTINISYCNDRPKCHARALNYKMIGDK